MCVCMHGWQVLVTVVSMQSGVSDIPHARFEEAKKMYGAGSGHPKALYFEFVEGRAAVPGSAGDPLFLVLIYITPPISLHVYTYTIAN